MMLDGKWFLLPHEPPIVQRRACPSATSVSSSSARCQTFRATGIITYLRNGGTILEHAQQIANHGSSRTTKL
jgi:hypothetical protein